jgi:hypothetical protein
MKGVCLRYHRNLLVIILLTACLLTACDPGGRLAQLTPQAPAATPMVLGITAEPPSQATESPSENIARPTAAYDPTRAAWTILYYVSADNYRADFVWNDINAMEAAGYSDQVQVVVQTDWPPGHGAGSSDLVRYVIQPDEDRNQIASPLSALGEGNMGDPATLENFLHWGITTFPANRYAVIIGDFGGGWRGCCLDVDIGIPGESDHLSLPDLDQALAVVISRTGVQLDVFAFTAGLMSQVDVLQTIQPFAAYAVAGPGLLPGSVWDYQSVLASLYSNPTMDGQQLARELANRFIEHQQRPEGDKYAGIAAIDLALLPRLSSAVESLALSLADDPDLRLSLAADARRGAQAYGAAALSDVDTISAVDLLHAAAILVEISPPGDLRDAAAEVTSAATAAVMVHEAGPGCCPNGRGIAIYWPATAGEFDPVYAQVTRLPGWADFLASFTGQPLISPTVDLTNNFRTTVNLSQPAIMSVEVIGNRLTDIMIVAAQETADGRGVWRQFETIQPAYITFPSGTSTAVWTDGRHETTIIWDTISGYLSDAAGNGDYVIIRAIDPSPAGPQLAVEGGFQPTGSDLQADTTLIFNPDSAESGRLWAGMMASSGTRLVGELKPGTGDKFRPSILITAEDNQVQREIGVELTFNEAASLFRSARPLPDGAYRVGVIASSLGGNTALATTPLNVDANESVAGYRAFVDAGHDVQFLYPVNWPSPTNQANVTFAGNSSSNSAEQVQLQVRYYPGWAGDLAALQTEVLSTFGEVSILQQDYVEVGLDESVEALRTAYGYHSPERGERTGVFMTFLRAGVGYVVDMDGPKSQEPATLATIDILAANWQFLSSQPGFGPETWPELTVGNYEVQYPSAYAYQPYNNWHRFTADPQTFIAIRVQPAGRTPAEAMTGLLNIAADGVTGFVAEEPYRFYLAGFTWERNDFSYVDATGTPITGLLLSRVDGDQEIALWAETPAEQSLDRFRRHFLPAAASIQSLPAIPEG